MVQRCQHGASSRGAGARRRSRKQENRQMPEAPPEDDGEDTGFALVPTSSGDAGRLIRVPAMELPDELRIQEVTSKDP